MANEIPSLDSLNLNLDINTTGEAPPVSPQQAAQVAAEIIPRQVDLANQTLANAQKANTVVNELDTINGQIQQELSRVNSAQLKQAEINKANKEAAIEANEFDVNVYNQTVNSETAKRQHLNATQRVQKKQAELNRLREESETGGFLTRFVNTFKEASVKSELLEAQQELRNINVTSLTAGQVLNSELANNAIAASSLTTAEEAQAQFMLETADAHLQMYAKSGKLKQSELEALGTKARFDSETMRSLNNVFDSLSKANSLSQASAAAAYQQAQLDSFLKQEKRREDAATKADDYWEQRQTDFDSFLRQMGREDDVGKINYRTLAAEARQAGIITDPTLQRFISWDTLYNTMGKGAYSNALVKRRQNAPMSMAEKNDLSLGQKLVAQHEAQLRSEAAARIKRISPSSKTREAEEAAINAELEAELIKMDTPEGLARANQLLDEHKLAAEDNIVPALASGNIPTLPFQSLTADPTTKGFLNKHVPEPVQALLAQEGWKDVQFQINPENPAASINATFDQLIDQIEKNAKSPAEQEALASSMGKALEGYYRTTVKYSANAMGYPLLNSFNVQGIDTGTGGLTGFAGTTIAPSLERIDLFNGAKIASILKARMRMRKVQKSAKSDLLQKATRIF